jgi:hypothetical protein
VKAVLVLDEAYQLDERVRAELVIWEVPEPVRGSTHRYKYRLALISADVCVLRYDNEAGKGDHRHLGRREHRCEFTDTAALLTDFWSDTETWLTRNER